MNPVLTNTQKHYLLYLYPNTVLHIMQIYRIYMWNENWNGVFGVILYTYHYLLTWVSTFGFSNEYWCNRNAGNGDREVSRRLFVSKWHLVDNSRHLEFIKIMFQMKFINNKMNSWFELLFNTLISSFLLDNLSGVLFALKIL